MARYEQARGGVVSIANPTARFAHLRSGEALLAAIAAAASLPGADVTEEGVLITRGTLMAATGLSQASVSRGIARLAAENRISVTRQPDPHFPTRHPRLRIRINNTREGQE